MKARRGLWLIGLLGAWLGGFGGAVQAADWGALTIRERSTAPGEKQRFSYATDRNFESSFLDFPIWVARGASPGPGLCLTAAIHGDELNGSAIARRVFASLEPEQLAGTLLAFPAVNAAGFRSGNRYMVDRRDLNRQFPGRENGSVASLVAWALFQEIVRSCDALIDLHTGSMKRRNVPQVRVDLSNQRALDIARGFGAGVVIGGSGPEGSLRRAVMDAGIPAVIYEAGGPHRFEVHEIEWGVKGVRNVMTSLGMFPDAAPMEQLARVFQKTSWVRVPVRQGGFFFPSLKLGAMVERGQLLGTVTDPQTDERYEIRAPHGGEVIGMAEAQVVLSGSALFHLGLAGE